MNKRIFSRSVISFPVELKTKSSIADVSSHISRESVDISEGGICFTLNHSLSKALLVTLQLNFPSPYSPIQIQAQVVWSDFLARDSNFRCGACFIGLKDDTLSILKKILKMGKSSKIPQNLKKDYSNDFINARREWLNKWAQIKLNHIGYYSEDSENMKGNIENLIGVCQIPLGIAGPIKINGQYAKGDFYVPMATTEGALVMTYHCGMRVINESGGVNAMILKDETHISPFFLVKNGVEGIEFISWVKNAFDEIKTEAEKMTKHGKLLSIDPLVVGKTIILKFSYFTGDAQGLNMINKATEAACKFISRNTNKKFFIRSNFSSIKKVSSFNIHKGQGKAVFAEVVIPRRVLRILQVTPEEMYELYVLGLSAGVHAGMVGANAHIANAIAAVYTACGQDIADVSVSHVGITTFEITETKDLYVSVYLPNLFIGTIGGGTGLGTQRECLEILGCYGSGKAKKFTEIVSATVLAGEITVMAALVNNTYVKAHEKYGRNRPKEKAED